MAEATNSLHLWGLQLQKYTTTEQENKEYSTATKITLLNTGWWREDERREK